MSRRDPSYELRTDRPRALCLLCDRMMSVTVNGTFRHHQLAPAMMTRCRNSGVDPEHQHAPPSPPRSGPPPPDERPVVII